jgi:hypothetical protein
VTGVFESIVALQGTWIPAVQTGLDGLIFLYVGPDQLLPLTSFFGAIVGILLMFWHRFLGGLRWIKRAVTGQKSASDDR